jgi:hypothetical protein
MDARADSRLAALSEEIAGARAELALAFLRDAESRLVGGRA